MIRVWKDRYREFGMEELAKTLTPQARVRYREIVMICLYENSQTWKQVFKLLRKPNQSTCMEGDGTMYGSCIVPGHLIPDTLPRPGCHYILIGQPWTLQLQAWMRLSVILLNTSAVTSRCRIFNEIPERCKSKNRNPVRRSDWKCCGGNGNILLPYCKGDQTDTGKEQKQKALSQKCRSSHLPSSHCRMGRMSF